MTITRQHIAALTLLALLALTGFDLATAQMDPFDAPAAIAFGSGQSAGGAHCAALPGSGSADQ